jgi:hypothetical protein
MTVQFMRQNDGIDEPTKEEVERWIESVPVRVLSR